MLAAAACSVSCDCRQVAVKEDELAAQCTLRKEAEERLKASERKCTGLESKIDAMTLKLRDDGERASQEKYILESQLAVLNEQLRDAVREPSASFQPEASRRVSESTEEVQHKADTLKDENFKLQAKVTKLEEAGALATRSNQDAKSTELLELVEKYKASAADDHPVPNLACPYQFNPSRVFEPDPLPGGSAKGRRSV